MKLENNNKIIEAFKKGEIKGLPEFGKIPEHVETQISHIFLFTEYAYKFYKWDNEGFNKYFADLGDPVHREQFYKDDFKWNNYFNQEVYLNLKQLKLNVEEVILQESDGNFDDYVIEMKRINTEENLTKLIINNQLTEQDAYTISYNMTKEIANFLYKPNYDVTYYELLKIRMNDLKEFSYFADPYIKKNETDSIIEILNNFVDSNKSELDLIGNDKLAAAIDNHSDNIFFNNDKVSFIDVYLPKRDWILLEPLANVVRPATDLLVLGGEKIYQGFLRGYKEYYNIDKIDKRIETFYQLENAMIKAAYLYDLYSKGTQRKDEADKYWKFVQGKIGNLGS